MGYYSILLWSEALVYNTYFFQHSYFTEIILHSHLCKQDDQDEYYCMTTMTGVTGMTRITAFTGITVITVMSRVIEMTRVTDNKND